MVTAERYGAPAKGATTMTEARTTTTRARTRTIGYRWMAVGAAVTLGFMAPAVGARADAPTPSPAGFANAGGSEVAMLEGPMCTPVPREYDTEVCEGGADPKWWRAAPVLEASGPAGQFVLRWASEAQPEFTRVRMHDADPDKGLQESVMGVSVVGYCTGERSNPCEVTHATLGSDAITYVVETDWDGVKAAYAVTVKTG